jgi:isopentenyl diphosphate isomerase/L-lactate dehydrogenase-like FMN-dependent dehydrogenase
VNFVDVAQLSYPSFLSVVIVIMRSSILLAASGLRQLAFATQAITTNTLNQEGLADTGLDTSSWTQGSLPPIASIIDINDFQIAAKYALAPADYAYYRTAALDEITYNNNLFIWEKIRLNGFSFADVSNINLKTSILGYQFNSPFFIAPAAQAGRASSGAETNLVKAAGAAGILYVPSISSTQSIQTIGAAATSGQVMFHQEYIWSDQNQLQTELQQIEAAGFKAIFLTVDNTGVNGIRDRQMRFSAGGDSGHSATFTIEALNQLRNMTDLPIVPKGVKTARDVKLCADLGFPAVYISNHGGRVVDMAPTAVEILLDLHKQYPEVFDQIEIYADGGVRRATHILTLLALGVRAVGLGRAPMFANAYGQAGVTKLINILNLELTTTMQLMGQSNIDGYRGNTSFVSRVLVMNGRAETDRA